MQRLFLSSLIIASVLFLANAPLYADLRVVDGDTLDLQGKRYRIHGIDTPERFQKCGAWECGKAATQALKELVSGQVVKCVPNGDVTYNRAVAVCYAGGQDVAQQLVSNGLAWVDPRYSDAYLPLQEKARAQKIGIWSGNYQTPWAYRKGAKNAVSQQPPDPNCTIKGNISSNGKIYHLRGSSRWYDKVKINTNKNERWFCTIKEAEAAGWRAPYH